VAGKTSILGINNPSLFDGAVALVARMSNTAFGVVVLIPTCAKESTPNKLHATKNSFFNFIIKNFSLTTRVTQIGYK
jgi:hypothetical protein